jgi:hypothetical protein
LKICITASMRCAVTSFQKNPLNFALFAEGPLDEIGKLQAEISGYITRLEQVGAA